MQEDTAQSKDNSDRGDTVVHNDVVEDHDTRLKQKGELYVDYKNYLQTYWRFLSLG